MHIAQNVKWHKNLTDSKTADEKYMGECLTRIWKLNKELPSGSGIDAGCEIHLEKSRPERIVIAFGFHHMDEGGYYDGWTLHDLILTPDFGGFKIKIGGPNKNFIKGYLYDLFTHELGREIEL